MSQPGRVSNLAPCAVPRTLALRDALARFPVRAPRGSTGPPPHLGRRPVPGVPRRPSFSCLAAAMQTSKPRLKETLFAPGSSDDSPVPDSPFSCLICVSTDSADMPGQVLASRESTRYHPTLRPENHLPTGKPLLLH